MAKGGPYVVAFTLIVRDGSDNHINGTGSRGDLGYAKKLAQSCLRTDRTGRAASVEIYSHDPAVPWQQLQPLATVSLDDEQKE